MIKDLFYDTLWTIEGILKGIKFTFKLITDKTFWKEWTEAIERNDGDKYILNRYREEADRICEDD